MQAQIRPSDCFNHFINPMYGSVPRPPNRGGFLYEHERDNRSQNDQCIYARNHDAEINVGQEPLRLELVSVIKCIATVCDVA